MHYGFLMQLILEHKLCGQLSQLLELIPDPFESGYIVIVVAPNGYAPVLLTYREYGAVDQLEAVLREEPADHVQQEIRPRLLRLLLHVIFNGEGHYPLTALAVARVLPLRTDTFTEHQIVSVGDNFCHGVHVVVHSPKVFYGTERKNLV